MTAMKTIWGFDLGTASIGNAVITTDNEGKPIEIKHMGVRIVPQTDADSGKDGAFTQFLSGNAISKNAKRTQRRTQRKGYDRYQMRRATLITALKNNGMQPDESCMGLEKLALWSLRSRAASERITLPELGRVLLHLNQKRGYKSARAEGNTKEDTDYVKTVNGRYEQLRELGLTVGQYLYEELAKAQRKKEEPKNKQYEDFRVKDLVYPRAAYMEEFDRIMAVQHTHYPTVLTDEFIRRLRDEIIYRQRPLKSCKGLVAVCEFEGHKQIVRGHERLCGPKVAPRSSPLAQICRIWEQVNNIRIVSKTGTPYPLATEQKAKIAEKLATAQKITWTQLQTLLGLRKSDGWRADKKVEKSGIQGNDTYFKIATAFGEEPIPEGLLDFPLDEIESGKSTALSYNQKSGEVLCEEPALSISPDVEQTPLYRLWHTIYSIADIDECAAALTAKFPGITPEVAGRLAAIDFTHQGFSNKSAKAIRKILPYLQRGYKYNQAMALAGYNHSGSLTTEERRQRPLKDRLDLLPKNALRQPVVEKILNQLINLTNAMLETYGKPDEIRIELARELKQNQEDRNKADKAIRDNERENKRITERLEKEYPGLRATRRTIQKYKLHQELAAIGSVCIYCGRPITLAEALSGDQVDVEHIIPRSLLFDDSMSNKTLSHQCCNREKGNQTARDYMEAKGPDAFAAYCERVDLLCKNSRTKRNKLLMPAAEIPDDFIDRQLRQSQYIARKAVELLSEVCTDVWTTSGSVTAYLRRVWGWEDTLMQLQLPRYREIEGAVEWVEYKRDGQTHRAERIVGWSKRDDHRHHAIDALTIACTRQGYIQRLNTLSQEKTRTEMQEWIKKAGVVLPADRQQRLADRYFASQQPFPTAEVTERTAGILISTKPGKRVTTPGVRKAGPRGERHVIQRVLVPRGPLSEESVYGNIRTPEYEKDGTLRQFPIKYLFEHPDRIVSKRVRQSVEGRIALCDNDPKAALRSLKSDPLLLPDGSPLTATACYTDEYVIRYPLDPKFDKTDKIVDPKLRDAVCKWLDGGAKDGEPFRWHGQIVRRVRCCTGLKPSAVEAVRHDPKTGAATGFVKPGNNHHIAFYTDPDEKPQFQICTFWHAVERKRMGLPVIIRNPSEAWDIVQSDMERFTPDFLEKLPAPEWQYAFSLQQNEMVILGLDPDVVHAAIKQGDYKLLGPHLYRMRGMSIDGNSLDLWFLQQYETQPVKDKLSQTAGRSRRIQSYKTLINLTPVKVRIDLLGRITEVTEP